MQLVNSNLLISILLLISTTATWGADYEKGKISFLNGNYEDTIREITPLAEEGQPNAQHLLGQVFHRKGSLQNYQTSLKWHTKAAKQENKWSQEALGWMYRRGEGVSQDHGEAVTWFRLAAAQGLASAQASLGWHYAKGFGVLQDYKKALSWYQRAAEQENSYAQARLGKFHENGYGTEQDYKSAINWYTLAAQQGNKWAQASLGEMYRSGKGGNQDLTTAIKWLTLAAEQNEHSSQFSVGQIYRNGEGVSRNYKLALKWFTRSAQQENPWAQAALGLMYRNGEGVPQDHEEAIKWYSLAAENGDIHSQTAVGTIYFTGEGRISKSYREALIWFQKAADSNDAHAQWRMGRIYERGHGTDYNYTAAGQWYEQAANQDFVPAIVALGSLYERGMYRGDLRSNMAKARELYLRAAEKDDLKALHRLGQIYQQGIGVKQDFTMAIDYFGRAAAVDLKNARLTGDEYLQAEADFQAKRIRHNLRNVHYRKYSGVDFGDYHALIIGNNNYQKLPKLKTAVNDAQGIATLLSHRYGFHTKLLLDATRKETLDALYTYRSSLDENDNFLIYYAGHGTIDRNTSDGYWQGVEAEDDNPTNWIANSRIRNIIKSLPAKHVMLIADSCYAATVMRGAARKYSMKKSLTTLRRVIKLQTRVALASGGDEPVVDSVNGEMHSVFAAALLNILSDNDDVLYAASILPLLRKEVVYAASTVKVQQTPEYSSMKKLGDGGGDFIFVPKLFARVQKEK